MIAACALTMNSTPCLSLIEINDHCNLNCPVCYAESGTGKPLYRSLAQIEKMVLAVVRE